MEQPPSPAPPWFKRPEAWVFCSTALLRLLVLSRLSSTPYLLQQLGDMKFYDGWAQRIVAGQFTDGHAFYGLPGYAFLLSFFYRLAGPDPLARIFSVGALQVIIESVTATLIFKIARVLCTQSSDLHALSGPSPAPPPLVAPLLAALGWALFIPAQTYSVTLMPTCWVVCAYWYCTWTAMKPRNTSVSHPWPVLGLLIGAMATVVATILFALPLLLARIGLSVGASLAPRARIGRALLAAALLVTGLFAGSSPVWIHNYFFARDPVFLSAHSGINFWIGNRPGANGYPRIPGGLRAGQEGLHDSIVLAERAAGRPLKRSEVSAYWSAQAHDYMARFPEAWMRLLVLKVRNFWNAFQYDDISVIPLFRERGILWPGLQWGLVAALGLTGAGIAVIRPGPARWVAAAVGLHMLAILPVFVTERYRLTAVPGLLCLGAYALWALWRAILQARWRTVASLAGGSLAAAGFVSLPTTDPALWALDPYNMGVKELAVAEDLLDRAGSEKEERSADAELARAERHLAAAYALVQTDPGIVFAIGNLWLDKGRRDRAKLFYERTLQLHPHFSGALNNLGYLALEEKRWDVAAQLLTEATRKEPENARGHYLLALAREGEGKLPEARAAAAEAVRLSPAQPQFLDLHRRLSTP
jgi:hypothetical protein